MNVKEINEGKTEEGPKIPAIELSKPQQVQRFACPHSNQNAKAVLIKEFDINKLITF